MSADPAFTRRLLLGQGFGAVLVAPALAHLPARHLHFSLKSPPLIVLDPGHGGKDPGAIGVSGTYEKHISFAAAQELARQLRLGGRYIVSLTRMQDLFIPLEDRVAIAQAKRAALFISLHADAMPNPDVSGASVYTLAATASDYQTASLAARENSADRFGPAGVAAPAGVSAILASLVTHETRVGSARMQQHIVSALGHATPMLDHPLRHAGFAVLKAADIPSVLIEMGFMSNRRDEQALLHPAYRAGVVAAIKRGVDGYFAGNDHPARVAG